MTRQQSLTEEPSDRLGRQGFTFIFYAFQCNLLYTICVVPARRWMGRGLTATTDDILKTVHQRFVGRRLGCCEVRGPPPLFRKWRILVSRSRPLCSILDFFAFLAISSTIGGASFSPNVRTGRSPARGSRTMSVPMLCIAGYKKVPPQYCLTRSMVFHGSVGREGPPSASTFLTGPAVSSAMQSVCTPSPNTNPSMVVLGSGFAIYSIMKKGRLNGLGAAIKKLWRKSAAALQKKTLQCL